MIDRTVRLGISSLLIISTLFAINTNVVMEAGEVDADAAGSREMQPAEEASGQEDVIEDTPGQDEAVQSPETPAVSSEEGLLIQTEPEQSQEEAIHEYAADDKKEDEPARSLDEETEETQKSTPDISEPSTGEAPPLTDPILEDTEDVMEPGAASSEEESLEPTGDAAGNAADPNEVPALEPSGQEESEDGEMPAAGEKKAAEPGMKEESNVTSHNEPPQNREKKPEEYDNSAPAKKNIPEVTSAPKFYRYDHGDILAGISLRPGTSDEELNLLDERVNELMCSRILRAD